MTLRVCNKLGCPELVSAKEKYCSQHKLPAWQGSTWTKPKGWERTRQSVLHRDKHLCVYCGAKATDVDHVIPVSRGGTHRLDNLVASCSSCNQAKNIQQRQQQEPKPFNGRA